MCGVKQNMPALIMLALLATAVTSPWEQFDVKSVVINAGDETLLGYLGVCSTFALKNNMCNTHILQAIKEKLGHKGHACGNPFKNAWSCQRIDC